MQRTLTKQLIAWKYDLERKPLVLRGARRTGKTWLLKEFGAQEFEHVAYVNLENNVAMQKLFRGSLDPERILESISSHTRVPIGKNTLVILDEIQSIPRAFLFLKHFKRDTSGCALAAAGSFLGSIIQEDSSLPAGMIELLDLYPFTFSEFLLAKGNGAFVRYIETQDFHMLDAHSEELEALLEEYLFVGGMPEAIIEHLTTGDFEKIRSVHNSILRVYESDFKNQALRGLNNRCTQIWRSVPQQLTKENKKFTYGAVQEGGRRRDFENALHLLEQSNLLYRVWRISDPNAPLEQSKDTGSFKLFLTDVGLLGAMLDFENKKITKQPLFADNSALAEQFVCQELKSSCGYYPYYWSAVKSVGKIDFLYQNRGKAYPVEVQVEENLRSKSLAFFCEQYELGTGVRLSLSSYRDGGWMKNLPLYAVEALR